MIEKTNINTILEKGTQQASVTFKHTINNIIEEKQEIKGQKIDNRMEITGIGQKCIKVENNFYNWDDIEYAALDAEEDEEIDEVIKSIIRFFFTGKYEEEQIQEYQTKKFTRTEAIQNWEQIKQEIITHKEHYKTGVITGIGEKTIMIGTGYETEYTPWQKIKEAITSEKIIDYTTIHHHSDLSLIIMQLFTDDDEERYTVEKQLYEKQDKYADEKAYIYRHIITEDLTVENIRTIIFNRHYSHTNDEKRDEIFRECLQFAFKYVTEIKFTDDASNNNEDNKYCVKNADDFFYTIKNKEIIYNEEKEGYCFKGYSKAVFKVRDSLQIDIYRKGKKVGTMPHALKPIYVSFKRNQNLTYELSCEQQAEILATAKNVTQVSKDEIKESFLNFLQEENYMSEQILETIQKQYPQEYDIDAEYDDSPALQNMANLLYAEGRIRQNQFYYALNAISLEQRINKDKIIDFVLFTDSSMNNITIADDKYGFEDEQEEETIHLQAGLASKEYSYSTNEEYTRIENTEAYVDTFAGSVCYIKGRMSQDDAIRHFEYMEGLELSESFKYYLIEQNNTFITKI